VTLQPTLSFPWEEEKPEQPAHLRRLVADGTNRVEWLRARSRGVTATDVARLSGPQALEAAAYDKINGTGFGGNIFTDHGKDREPHIARYVRAMFGVLPSSSLFHAEGEKRHLATPDGIAVTARGTVELAEIKTTNKAWRSIPRHYLRQIWWQQYVRAHDRGVGAARQLHSGRPGAAEPLGRPRRERDSPPGEPGRSTARSHQAHEPLAPGRELAS
jgi:hypothetical protein